MQKTEKFFINQLEKKQQLEEYINIVNQIHSHLTKETYFFLENEYLNFYDTYWWVHLFSKATYYRLKHKALDELIESSLNFWTHRELINLID